MAHGHIVILKMVTHRTKHWDTFSFRAFLRKNALHDSQDMASKLQPNARSPHTRQSLSSLDPDGDVVIFSPFILPPPSARLSKERHDDSAPCWMAQAYVRLFQAFTAF